VGRVGWPVRGGCGGGAGGLLSVRSDPYAGLSNSDCLIVFRMSDASPYGGGGTRPRARSGWKGGVRDSSVSERGGFAVV
jgi:hypothetical protein